MAILKVLMIMNKVIIYNIVYMFQYKINHLKNILRVIFSYFFVPVQFHLKIFLDIAVCII